MGKELQKPDFSSVAATFEKAITYVFAARLIRNAEASGFDVARTIRALREAENSLNHPR